MFPSPITQRQYCSAGLCEAVLKLNGQTFVVFVSEHTTYLSSTDNTIVTEVRFSFTSVVAVIELLGNPLKNQNVKKVQLLRRVTLLFTTMFNGDTYRV